MLKSDHELGNMNITAFIELNVRELLDTDIFKKVFFTNRQIFKKEILFRKEHMHLPVLQDIQDI